MQRCIAGIDTREGLDYVENGSLGVVKERPPPRREELEYSQKMLLNRPKTAKQKVGYGGLGPLADPIVP